MALLRNGHGASRVENGGWVGRYFILDWQKALFDEYMTQRRRSASCAPSTQRTIQSAVFSFFVYMNEKKIQGISEVQAADLQEWHLHSDHASARARNIYTSQLRLFFEHLAERGKVEPTLPFALICQHAPLTTVVSVLNTVQLEAINAYCCNARTPIQLRDAAMLKLGLRMGIRAVDICKLRPTDINWSKRTISFVQQKTGVFIELPMPTEVGNALYRYIMEGRPGNSNSDCIFLRHRPPYTQLESSGAPRNAMKRVFKRQDNAPDSFHITRRTFASGLLRSGSSSSLIASVLGHTMIDNVAVYLSTDDENLLQCAIGCKGIEYSGRYGL